MTKNPFLPPQLSNEDLLFLRDWVFVHHHLDEGVGGLAGQLNAGLGAHLAQRIFD